MPWLGGEGVKIFNKILLWQHYDAGLADQRPGEDRRPCRRELRARSRPSGCRRSTRLILLTSGVTVTIAHHALRAGNRRILGIFLALTFLLGFTFVYLQATEYHEAYTELGLKLSTGIYGSTFFMLTGFHGLHVTIGAIMLR